jgi:uroporphyrinogen decarboxylase
MVQIFDSWAGELTPYHFKTFALPALLKIASLFRSKLSALGVTPPPIILFAKGANTSLKMLSELGVFDVLALDWCITPEEAKEATGGRVALQGNADPLCMYGNREGIEGEVKRVCEGFIGEGKGPKGWISNLYVHLSPVYSLSSGHALTTLSSFANLSADMAALPKYVPLIQRPTHCHILSFD